VTWRRHLPALVLAATCFGLFLFIQYRWFPHLSKNNDEPVYLFQAAMYRDGHLTLPNLGLGLRPWMSGTYGDRIVMVFPPGWPAVLAVALTILRSAKVVGALAATTGVLGVYAFAAEILRDRRAALVAGGFVALCPLMLVLGGTVLSYPFALGVGALLGTTALRAVREGSPRWLLGTGAAAGLLVTMRPMDALIATTSFGLFLLWSWRREVRHLVTGFGWAVAGASPFVVAVLVANHHVTGSPLRFPLQANGGDNSFGFGPRYITAGARVFDVTPKMMGRVTGRLLGEMPHWTLGGLLVAPLVAWGAVRLWQRRPAFVLLLTGMAALVPAAHFFYWGTHFVWVGRRDYGPFYYLPMVLPLAVGTSEGLVALARRWRIAAVLAAVAVLATLPAAMAPKLRRAEAHNAAVAREVRLVDRLPKRSLVILPGSNDGPWMLHVRGYFANPPDLHADRLFAADTGTGNIELAERFHRPVFQLYGVIPGDRTAGRADPVVARLHHLAAPALRIDSSFRNGTDNPTVVAYVGLPGGFVRCVMDEASSRDRTYRATWTLTATGPQPPPGCTPLPPVHVNGRPLVGNLVVGYSASATTELDGVNRWEYLYALRTGGPSGSVEVLDPGVPRRTSAGDLGDPLADYPGQVDHVLTARITPLP
jgi:hypothetical protein